MRPAQKVIVIAVVHFGLSAAVLLALFQMGMSRFDTGADAAWLEQGLVVVQEILSFPIVTVFLRESPAAQLFPGMNSTPFLQWIPCIMNSVLWGLAVTCVTAVPFRRRSAVSCDKPVSGEFVGD